jgi:hypothetical protein
MEGEETCAEGGVFGCVVITGGTCTKNLTPSRVCAVCHEHDVKSNDSRYADYHDTISGPPAKTDKPGRVAPDGL